MKEIFFHAANAFLIFPLGRLLGLERRVCVIAALIFASLSIHAHALFLPSAASGRPSAVTCLLAVLILYLRTQRPIAAGKNSSRGWLPALPIFLILAVFRTVEGCRVAAGLDPAAPWAAILASFLDPIGAALEPNGGPSLFPALLAIAMAGVFLGRAGERTQAGRFLLVWYGASWFFSSPLMEVTPIFALVAAAVAVDLWRWMARPERGSRFWKEGSLAVSLFLLCGANLMGIGLLQWKEKGAAFSRGLEQRPLLLRALLGDKGRLEDVRWLTDGRGLRVWLSGEQALQGDLEDLKRRLAYRAFTDEKLGCRESGRHWLAQLRFLEPDREALLAWLERDPAIREIEGFPSYLEKARGLGFLEEPVLWREDDYAVGRFLLRHFTGWDIRRRGEEALSSHSVI